MKFIWDISKYPDGFDLLALKFLQFSIPGGFFPIFSASVLYPLAFVSTKPAGIGNQPWVCKCHLMIEEHHREVRIARK